MLTYLTTLFENPEDRKKLKALFKQYRKKLQYTAEALLHDKHAAEDIVQETFVKVIDHLDKIDETDCSRTQNYLVTIAKNKCFNYLKQKKVIPLPEEDSVFADLSIEENPARRMEQEDLRERMAALNCYVF